MPLTVSQIRQREDTVDAAYLLALDGIPQMFVTGHTGEGLIGTGAGSWIRQYEDAVGDTPNRRSVLAGLVMPSSIELGRLDVKAGTLEATQVGFTLVDFDGTVAGIFAVDGKDYEVLAEDIQPGTSALGTSVLTVGGGVADNVNPRGRYIGLEKIGPSGQRVEFSCLPFARIGEHHVSHATSQNEDGPPPIRISASPIDHAGRLAALYRIYRDPLTGAWPSWDAQYAGGGLVWFGKLMDHGEIRPDRSWSIKCAGPEALLQKTLNNNTATTPMLVSPAVTLADHERSLGLEFWTYDPPASIVTRASASMEALPVFGSTLTKADAITALTNLMAGVISGVGDDYGSGNFDTINDADAFVSDNGTIHVIIQADNVDPIEAGVRITMHEKVWRIMGWDPALQQVANTWDPVDEKQAVFKKIGAGGQYSAEVFSSTPGEGYWRGTFTTLPLAFGDPPTAASLHIDNDGLVRRYSPLYQGDVQILAAAGEQQIGISMDQPFIEGDPAVPRSSSEINGTAVNQARYFAFFGKIATAIVGDDGDINAVDNGALIDGTEIEGRDLVQVAAVEWNQLAYGQPSEISGTATVRIRRWLHPKHFSFNHEPLNGEWMGVAANEDFAIKCLPLASYAYNDPDAPSEFGVQGTQVDHAPDVLCQLLLSSGTSTGYNNSFESATEFTRGLNMQAGASFWAADVKRADLGLAIPYQLVADVDDIASAFDEVPQELNQVRYAYGGPFESLDLLESLLRPRGLAVSLRGNRFGAVRLGIFSPADADMSIGEADLDDAFGDNVSQQLRAMGQLDQVRLSHGWNAVESEHGSEMVVRARDASAKARFGDLTLEIRDDGLTPWTPVDGVGDWKTAFRGLWSKDRPDFFSRRHFKITGLRVSRIKGQDLQVGSRVLLSNPWVMGSNGVYGLDNAAAIIIGIELSPSEHVYVCEALVYADADSMRLWSPMGVVASVSGAVVTLNEAAPYARASDFGIPSWAASGATHGEVSIVTWDGSVWAVYGPYTIGSVNSGAGTVTLTAAPGLPIRDRDKFLIAADYDSQDAGRWPRDELSVLTLGNGKFGSGPTKGWPLVP